MSASDAAHEARIPRLGAAVLLHGFTRAPRHLSLLSRSLTRMGVATVRPALGSFAWGTSMNNAHHLDRVAERLSSGLPDGPVMVVGHSAGAAAGAWLAARLLTGGVDVRGIVMVDGNDSPTHLIRRSWPSLTGIPVRAVCAPPSRCNRQGQLATWLAQQPGDLRIVVVEGSGHGDIEGVPASVYRWACGDEPNAAAQAEVLDLTLTWVREGLMRDR